MQKQLADKINAFINPNIDKNFAYYSVRQSLIKAIKQSKDKFYGNILDVGCGIMPYKEFICTNKKVINYTGVDLQISDYHNLVAPDLFWDGKSLPVENESFDWVIATEFFEHYYDINSILKEIHRVLKPGGKLFFTVPFLWPLHEIPYDQHRFTPFFLEKKFEELNFTNIKIKPLGGYNTSLAQMLGIYVAFASINSYKRKILKFFLKPILKSLLKNEDKNIKFANNQMISGLYGFVQK